jgi:carboxypeptidase Taq
MVEPSVSGLKWQRRRRAAVGLPKDGVDDTHALPALQQGKPRRRRQHIRGRRTHRMQKLNALKGRLNDVHNLGTAMGLLGWDQQTCMPPGGAGTRAAQMGTLSKLAHELLVSAETGRLLAEAEAEGAGLAYDSDEAALLRAARHDYDLEARLPTDLVVETARTTALAFEEWHQARAASDYGRFAPWLGRIVGLARRRAEALGYPEQPYDALLDEFEPGMRTSRVAAVFDELKAALVPMVRAVAGQADRVDDAVLRRDYAEDRQEEFCREVAARLGYDFSRGRLDRSAHPFSQGMGRGDVRITTRYERNWLPGALFGTIHETGHALYEQGVASELDDTLLGTGASLGIHESQSRLWENLVGRSRGFWSSFFPRLEACFPQALAGVDAEAFYRAVNRCGPSPVRVEADELTYNLHVVIRFEMELGLLSGEIGVADAPAAWNERYRTYLGITPPDDRQGILQDVHWSGGSIGYFPTYTLGNLMSVQLFDRAVAERPGIPAGIAAGEFDGLLGWLRETVHRHGRKYLPEELLRRATGSPLQAGPYLAYLRRKYGELYAL